MSIRKDNGKRYEATEEEFFCHCAVSTRLLLSTNGPWKLKGYIFKPVVQNYFAPLR